MATNTESVKKEKSGNIFKRMGKGISNFFKGISGELKRVTWPTKKELFKNTISVLVVCFVIGLIIFGIDSLLQWLLTLIR